MENFRSKTQMYMHVSMVVVGGGGGGGGGGGQSILKGDKLSGGTDYPVTFVGGMAVPLEKLKKCPRPPDIHA